MRLLLGSLWKKSAGLAAAVIILLYISSGQIDISGNIEEEIIEELEIKQFESREEIKKISRNDEIQKLYPEWYKTYGGFELDIGYSIQNTSDGGFIIAGHTYSYSVGSADVWLLKTDSMGNEKWNRTFGGGGVDNAVSVQEVSTGGFILTGATNSYGAGDMDVWLIRTDSYGRHIWNRTFGGKYDDIGYYVIETSDGGFAVTGETASIGGGYDISMYPSANLWLIKTDSQGKEIWNRSFNGPLRDAGYCVRETSDKGLIVGGTKDSFFDSLAWLIKTDFSGMELWNRTYKISSYDMIYCIQETSDGGFISVIGSEIGIFNNPYPYTVLLKTNRTGIEQWNRTILKSVYTVPNYVIETSDDGYIVTGYIDQDFSKIFIAKTNSTGFEEWVREFDLGSWDKGHSIIQALDGGFIIVGESYSFEKGSIDMILLKTDFKGGGIPPVCRIESFEVIDEHTVLISGIASDKDNVIVEIESYVDNNNYEPVNGTIKWYLYLNSTGLSDGEHEIRFRAYDGQYFSEYCSVDLDVRNGSFVNDQPGLMWWTLFGGENDEFTRDVHQTFDGGFIVTGLERSYFENNYYYDYFYDSILIKTDNNGNKIWNKTFDLSPWEYPTAVEQTSNGDYVVLVNEGYVWSPYFIKLRRYNSEGIEKWNRTFEGIPSSYASQFKQTSDGGFIIAGETYDFLIIKTDGDGKEEWNQTFGWMENSYATAVEQTSDGGFIVIGHARTDEGFNGDYMLLKLRENGTKEWEKSFVRPWSDHPNDVHQTSDGGYIIVGNTPIYNDETNYYDNVDIWLIKTDSSGNKEWDSIIGGSGNDFGRAVLETPDGGFIIIGKTDSFGKGETDVWLIKTDFLGRVIYNRTFGGSGSDGAHTIQITDDGNYIVSGASNSFTPGDYDVFLLKINSSFDNVPDFNDIPECYIEIPEENAEVKKQVRIRGTAVDSDGTVAYVELKIDDGNWTAVSGTSSWDYNWDTTLYKNGEHKIYARANDGEQFSFYERSVVTVIVNNSLQVTTNETNGTAEPWFQINPYAGAVIVFVVIILALMAVHRKRSLAVKDETDPRESMKDDVEKR